MPSAEERRKIGQTQNADTRKELYEVSKHKIKLPKPDGSGGHSETQIHWEGLTYSCNASGKWVKTNKQKFHNDIDAKIWVNKL